MSTVFEWALNILLLLLHRLWMWMYVNEMKTNSLNRNNSPFDAPNNNNIKTVQKQFMNVIIVLYNFFSNVFFFTFRFVNLYSISH